jgi:2-dehydropantoate 2-reductase
MPSGRTCAAGSERMGRRGMTEADRPPIVLVGSGAMACLFAVRLAGVARVSILGTWPAGLQAIRKRGVRLHTSQGEWITGQVRVLESPPEGDGVALALVLVKSWQTGRAAEQLANILAPKGMALTLQNGLGNLELLQETLGEARSSLGATTYGATLIGPGEVREGGPGTIDLAEGTGLDAFARLFEAAGFQVRRWADLRTVVWRKLIINSGINPVSALLRVSNGRLLEIPEAHGLMLDLARETGRVADALGIAVEDGEPGAMVEQVASRTAGNRSSMLQDVLRGAPTEVDAINGAVVRQAQDAGIAAPFNLAVWRLIRGAHLAGAHDGRGDAGR